MALRFRGLVAAARRCDERLEAGIAPGEREAFLCCAREILQNVEEGCREHATRMEDLPSPSRMAIAKLRRAAAIPAERLPLPREGGPRPRVVRVTNVVGNLESYLGSVALARENAERMEDVYRAVTDSVSSIEKTCAAEGGTPGNMPARSARAFAMLKWLSSPENFARYVEQVRRATGPFAGAAERLWGEKARETRVVFAPGRHLWSARMRAGVCTWRLAVGFLAASEEELGDAARAAGKRPDPEASVRQRAFADSPAFREIYRALDARVDTHDDRPRGRSYDLAAIFSRLNAEFFAGRLSRPKLRWRAAFPRGRYGSYDAAHDAVALHSAMDDPRVPEYVAAFVLYHELLHKVLGLTEAGSRRIAHTREFREEECRFPRMERANAWLAKLTRRRDRMLRHASGTRAKARARTGNSR